MSERTTDTTHDGIAVLPAYVTPEGDRCLVWCPYCETYHTHGYGPHTWHKSAHCHSPDSPYRSGDGPHGYILHVVPGPPPPPPSRNVQAATRRRPR